MEILIVVFCVIWGILSIILFFKLWGMCNNVSEILDEIRYWRKMPSVESEVEKEVKKLSVSEAAKSCDPNLMAAFMKHCHNLFKESLSKEDFEERIEEIIRYYNGKSQFDFSTIKDGLWERMSNV